MKSAGTFSIIVPTYNRVSALRECLQGIVALAFPRTQFQVIVVNDGGTTIPVEMQESLRSELDVDFYSQGNRGPAAARNFGAARAGGDWLVFTDDDCIPLSGWLTELARAAENAGNNVLGGSVVNGVADNPNAEASQMLFSYLYRYYHCSDKRRSQYPFFTSNNLALRRAVFDEIGGFDPSLRNAEDRELCARVQATGLNLQYVPAARVVHSRPMSLGEFWRLHTSYGRGGFEYYRRQQARGVTKFQPEGLGFYTELLLYPWRQSSRHDAVRLSALLALSQFANAFGFFRAVRSANK